MAIVKIPASNTTHRDAESVTAFLATHGIDYRAVDAGASGRGRCAA